MILYTPMQPELVFEGIDKMPDPQYKEITHLGVKLQVEKTGAQYRVVRVFSTNPADYLRPEFQPGAILDFGFEEVSIPDIKYTGFLTTYQGL